MFKQVTLNFYLKSKVKKFKKVIQKFVKIKSITVAIPERNSRAKI